LLQRILHLQTRAWPGPFRPERNRRIRFIPLEGDRGHIDIHGSDVDFSGNVVDDALANSFFAFTGAIAACQGTSQDRNHGEGSHGSIIPFDRIASMRPLSSNREASTVTRMPNFPAVAEVTGPIEATETPASASAPMAATRFSTVEELVNVIQSGLCGAASSSRARAPRLSGGAVR